MSEVSKAFVYARVSTDRQTLENQKIQIREFARKHDLTIPEDGWFEDDATHGWVPAMQRKGFRDMVETLQAMKSENPADMPKHVLAYEVSRLGRSFWDILEIVKPLEDLAPLISTSPKEAFLQVVDKSMRQIFIAFLAWGAEREKDYVSQRTKDGVERAHKQDRHSGNIPLGYRIDHSAKDCERLGHKPKECEIHGKLFLDDRGKNVMTMLAINPDLTAREVMEALKIQEYKEAWNLLRSIKTGGHPTKLRPKSVLTFHPTPTR